jgi:hypothetical protein
VVVTVRSVFGLARAADGREALTLELPPAPTVFEAGPERLWRAMQDAPRS